MSDTSHGPADTTHQSKAYVPRRPPVRVWLIAGAELVAAALVARVLMRSEHPANGGHGHTGHGHTGHDMADMMPEAAVAVWRPLEYGAIAVGALALLYWSITRSRPAAALAAAAVVVIATSPPMRTLAVGSHLVAMAIVEGLATLAPLLLFLPGWRSDVREPPIRQRTTGWNVLAVAMGLLYAVLLAVIHVPEVHHRAGELGMVPVWATVGVFAIGLGYWYAVVGTSARVSISMRRAVLIGGQEVAAFVGLLSMFGAWGGMSHHGALGVSAVWDQRLGGALMLLTCAAVAVPLLRSFTATADPDRQASRL